MLRSAVIQAVELDRQVSLIQTRVEEKLKKTKTSVVSRELLPGDIAATVLCATAADAIERELGRPLIIITGMGRVVAAAGPVITVNRLALNYAWGENEVVWPQVIRSKNPIPGSERLILASVGFDSDRDRLLPVVRSLPWYVSEVRHRSGTFTVHLDGEALVAAVTIEGQLAPALGGGSASGLEPTLDRM